MLVLAYCAIIFSLSAMSHPLPQLTAHVWDKALHAVEYGGLGTLLALALGVWDEPQRLWRVGLAILLGCAYGVSDETHQFFVPGRDAEVGDALADGVGTTLGVCLVWVSGLLWARRASSLGTQISAGPEHNSG
jgi:VanZ family protein